MTVMIGLTRTTNVRPGQFLSCLSVPSLGFAEAGSEWGETQFDAGPSFGASIGIGSFVPSPSFSFFHGLNSSSWTVGPNAALAYAF